mmetsp:Transcript_20603/g.48901  ORF Transcript_20603/g.48901 Transcript_20603/m.48901 type:complete len:390 (+) Transcript_20603:2-1171(+)
MKQAALPLVWFLTQIYSSHSLIMAANAPTPDSSTMKAASASALGPPDQVLTVVNDMPRPEPDDKSLIIKVQACSLSPGDYRGLLGDKKIIHKTAPYIPGGDVCGTVTYVPEAYQKAFQVGDSVVATWDMFGIGGLAEYAPVNPKLTVKLPQGLTPEQGAALVNTACHARDVIKMAKIQQGDRVLVLGGSGGVGTLLVQLLRSSKVSYIAATSTDAALMKTLGVDQTIDYTQQNFWEMTKFQNDNKFDCIIDLAVGVEAWNSCEPVLKGCREGGRFVAVVGQQWHIHADTFGQVLTTTLLPPLKRQLFNLFRWTTPYYKLYLGGATPEAMTEMLQEAADGKLKVTLDVKSPHSFTTQGVRDAFNHHIARKGHGKIVIQLVEENESDKTQE